MAENDDGLGLGLSLSLKCPVGPNINPLSPAPAVAPSGVPFPMNLFRSPMPFFHQQLHRSSINDGFQLSSDRNVEPISSLRGFDMNRAVTVVGGDDEVMVSSPNSTVSSLSGKRSEREEIDGEMEEDCSDAARKKLRLSKEQGVILEEAFKLHNTLNPRQKVALAKQLNLRPRQVEVWFQNRRARTKLKQTEVDCEYLKRCCENLTDENRRLHKEVNELRALKMSPQFYMNMSPPTTLTMCPQCERVSSSSSAATSLTIGPTTKPVPLTREAPPHLRQLTMASWAAVIPPQPAQRPQS